MEKLHTEELRTAKVDRRGRLEGEPFRWRATKGGTVFVAWQGKTVLTLKGDKARTLLRAITDADPHEVQLALAKATGHFKHGNERR